MKWRTNGLRDENGIILGSDERQEWLLVWWWENYQRHNQFPVAFIDFGLSEKMKAWCKERGEFIPLRIADIFVKDREEVNGHQAEEWEKYYGEAFWTSRKAWFKKPLACLQSPFQKTLWIDTDCEILGSLEPLFKACEHPSGIALAKDRITNTYNSGVIAFERNNQIIQEWAEQSLEKNGIFRSDQDLLSHLLLGKSIHELPPIYNWNVGYGENPEIVICHWLGDMGKLALRHQIMKSF